MEQFIFDARIFFEMQMQRKQSENIETWRI